MNAYQDPVMVQELRQFHLAMGEHFESMGGQLVQEVVVAKMLRCEVGQVVQRLNRNEQIEWTAALDRKEMEYADRQGWTLSVDIPSLLRKEF